ncbi:hypothetical protein MKX01_032260 [Papaver californicum]|nr:hypothetical protein MKX01_032260 [Papaver californicum]
MAIIGSDIYCTHMLYSLVGILNIFYFIVCAAVDYECEKLMLGIFRGPCQPHCNHHCELFYFIRKKIGTFVSNFVCYLD